MPDLYDLTLSTCDKITELMFLESSWHASEMPSWRGAPVPSLLRSQAQMQGSLVRMPVCTMRFFPEFINVDDTLLSVNNRILFKGFITGAVNCTVKDHD